MLLAPKDITDYTIADTEYWRETGHRLLIKTAYPYNDKAEIQQFPLNLGDWNGADFKYSDDVYKLLNADIFMSRAYSNNGNVIWMDIINSKTGESFHKQDICVQGAGWNIDNENIAEFKIADSPNPFTKLYANRLDISKENEKQVMIYWFMFKKFGSNDAVTMIRISAPVNNNANETFDYIKNFLEGQLFGAMYRGIGKEEITTAEYLSKEYGNKGLMAMMVGLLIPVGLVITGIRKKD